MKKVLFSATVDSHILQFHLPFLKLFKEMGYEVHVATNGNEEIPYCDVKHVVSFERNPFKINNLKAIYQLKKICNEEMFDIIHTHTPMGSVVTRLAARNSRKKYNTRVIYTAHGFHFFKGASLKNWLLFYPVEKWLARYTDTLITINNEDYELAQNKFSKRCNDIQYVPGVGIDEEKFDFKMTEKEKQELRNSLGLKKDDFVIIYPAEISKRKRQEWLISSVDKLLKANNDIHILLPGKDSLKGKCQQLVDDLKLNNQIHFLGYRKDIPKLLKISNLAISTASQEGLPVNVMEALYNGLPVVVTDCRGNRDLVINGKNGYLTELTDSTKFSSSIQKIYVKKIKFNNNLISNYLLGNVMKLMEKIYFGGSNE
jgi:glycosyltransferase EpsD